MTGLDSVLLIAFGGPEKPEDIRPFLRIVAQGRGIPAERLEEVARHYEAIGGRNWRPFLHETLAEMKRAGHLRALGIILSSFQTEASWERYAAAVASAR